MSSWLPVSTVPAAFTSSPVPTAYSLVRSVMVAIAALVTNDSTLTSSSPGAMPATVTSVAAAVPSATVILEKPPTRFLRRTFDQNGSSIFGAIYLHLLWFYGLPGQIFWQAIDVACTQKRRQRGH